MSRFINRIKVVLRMVATGEIGLLGGEIKRRLYSNERSLGLQRDLEVPFETPAAKLALEIRPLREGDVAELLNEHDEGISQEAVKERAQRKLLLREKIPTCYVAVTEEGKPAFMQWLMAAEDNDKIQAYFRGGFPVLKPDEGLLEFAFSLEKYRGMRIMPHAMAEIAKKGRDFGAKKIITFVPEDNIPSLKGCKRAGFFPYLVRVDRWRCFRRCSEFQALPPGTTYTFDG